MKSALSFPSSFELRCSVTNVTRPNFLLTFPRPSSFSLLLINGSHPSLPLLCPYFLLLFTPPNPFFSPSISSHPFFPTSPHFTPPHVTSRHRISGTIEEGSQLNFIYRGFVRLLNNVHLSESSYLPFSVTRMSIEQVRRTVCCSAV